MVFRTTDTHTHTKLAAFCEAAAFVFILSLCGSCKEKLATTESISNIDTVASMVIENMHAEQTRGSRLSGVLTAPIMKRYTFGAEPYDIFPNSFRVIGYDSNGEIETEITADEAIHRTGDKEVWEAHGNVVIKNHIKQEVMETDTLFWDRGNGRLYTHCFVKITSPSFYMQGYGMEADERASNAKILRPFDSYGDFEKPVPEPQEQDSTKVQHK